MIHLRCLGMGVAFALAAGAGGRAAAQQLDLQPAAAASVHLAGGDFASGRLLDSPSAECIVWQADGFALPLEFPLASVHSVHFSAPRRAPGDRGPYGFELAGGDMLFGGLASLDENEALLEIPGLGTLHVARAVLLRFYRTSAADLVFAGPGRLDDWKQTGLAGAWREEAGHLSTDRPGATIRRDIRPPPLARYEFELSWTGPPNFELACGLGEHTEDQAAFRLETSRDSLVVLRESGSRADLAVVQSIATEGGRARLVVLYDQPQGRILVHSSAGERRADFTVPEERAPTPPRITKAQPSALLRAPSNQPRLPGGIRLTNRKGNVKLERLNVSRWSGVAPVPAEAGLAAIQLADGSTRSQVVRSLDPRSRELVVVKDGTEERIAERQVADVVLLPPNDALSSGAVQRSVSLLLFSGMRISGELESIGAEQLVLRCPGIAERVLVPLRELQALLVLQAPQDSAADAADFPGLEPSSPRAARVVLPGVSLSGRLVDATAGGDSCLIFQARTSRRASPLAPDASGRVVLKEPPAPVASEPAADATASPAMQVARGMRTLLGMRQMPGAAGLRPARPGDCLLHLRTGDILLCRVLQIDEGGVTFKSTMTDAEFVPHERVKALELRPDAPPVKMERRKFERLLMLPRMQRDNPPEHLIRSLEGDYLRGRLLAMNDNELHVELHLEARTIDRGLVSRILWLHPDEAAGAMVRKPEPARETQPKGIRVQAVPASGHRLTFFAQELSGTTLSGHSDVLGACHVELERIDQLLIGQAIEEAAQTLAFHQWKLRPAPEPLPEPEPGSDPGSGAGMESVLVGKPAPPIELDLLDGKKFRLADCKGKVVVLDFWASWCGPCLQTMPQVDAVAREFADEGVQLVAINLEEMQDRIESALNRLKLQTPVALDTDGRTAERYGATSIPQTVIIDREGNVARLFVGGGPRFDEQLRLALRAVLSQSQGQ